MLIFYIIKTLQDVYGNDYRELSILVSILHEEMPLRGMYFVILKYIIFRDECHSNILPENVFIDRAI